MSEFTRQLRKQLSGETKAWGDINPLVVIGLTEAVLDLGLQEGQLYSSIRSYARQLSAQVHPDKNLTNVSPQRQRDIIEAFDFLDNQENFSAALADFKNLRAEDRREIVGLKQTISALRRELTAFEGRKNVIVKEQERLQSEYESYRLEKKKEPLRIPFLEKEIESLQGIRKSRERGLKTAQVTASNWKKKYAHLCRYLERMDNVSENVFVFDARWLVVVSMSSINSANPPLAPFDEKGELRANFLSSLTALKLNEDERTRLVHEWKRVHKVFKFTCEEEKTYRLGLTVMKLKSGRPEVLFGSNSSSFAGRVVGSIGWITPDRRRLRDSLSPPTITELMVPVLIPGALLVSLKALEKRFAPLDYVSLDFDTRKLILAVG